MEQEDRIGGRRKAGIGAGLTAGAFSCLMLMILVVIAFLFPTVNYARPAARRSACMSNMKQLANALMMYCQDYDGRFPIARRWDTDLMPYIKDMRLFRCPARPSPNAYGFNSKLSGIDSSRLANPPGVTMLFESSMGSPGTADTLTSFLTPHDGMGGVAYADGHVKMVTTAPPATIKLKKKNGK
jgi:prepilin-type processing-associated H-X9-DG protein